MDSRKTSLLGRAFLDSLPVLFGYAPVGMTFGLLFVKAGLPWYAALLASIFVYSGATQFLLLSFVAAGTPLPSAFVTILLLNLRHTFFGLSLIRKYGDTGASKPYLVFALTDETYALAASAKPDEDSRRRYFLLISAMNHAYWIAGTAVGALIGSFVRIELAGLEFALTALFTVLAIEQWKSAQRAAPFIVAVIAGILARIFVPPAYMLLVAIGGGVLVLLLPGVRRT